MDGSLENFILQGKFLRVGRGCQASQRKGLTSGEVRELPGKLGELPGKFGKLPGNLWIAGRFHSERTSGKVAEKLPGKFGELPANLSPKNSGRNSGQESENSKIRELSFCNFSDLNLLRYSRRTPPY